MRELLQHFADRALDVMSNTFEGAAAFSYDPAGLRCEISAPFTPRLGREVLLANPT